MENRLSLYLNYKIFVSIDIKFCSSPVSSFGIISNFAISFESEPIGHRSILIHLFSQSFLKS